MAVLQMQRISICAMKKNRKAILEELQSLDDSYRNVDVEEFLVPLRHVLDILDGDEKGGNYNE